MEKEDTGKPGVQDKAPSTSCTWAVGTQYYVTPTRCVFPLRLPSPSWSKGPFPHTTSLWRLPWQQQLRGTTSVFLQDQSGLTAPSGFHFYQRLKKPFFSLE